MNDSQLPNIHRIDVGFSAPGLVANDADRAVMNRYVEAVENMFNIRTSFLQQMLDPRRDIDAECGYPETVAGGGFGSINPDLYRALYEREAIPNRVVQIYPNACWQKSPMVFESEDPEVITPFEEAWDNIAKQLRGEACHYQDEEGSPIWNYCHRVDTLSGIGAFGVMLLGIADGKNLDQPLDGVSSYDPTGNMEVQWEDVGDEIREVPYIDPVTNRLVTRATKVRRDCFIRNLVINSETKQLEEKIVGVRRSYGGRKTAVYPTTPRAVPDPTCNDLEVTTYPIYEGDPKTGMPRLVRREKYPGVDHTNNQASPTNNGVILPQQTLLSNSDQERDEQGRFIRKFIGSGVHYSSTAESANVYSRKVSYVDVPQHIAESSKIDEREHHSAGSWDEHVIPNEYHAKRTLLTGKEPPPADGFKRLYRGDAEVRNASLFTSPSTEKLVRDLDWIMTPLGKAIAELNDGMGYGQGWYNPSTEEVWISVGDWRVHQGVPWDEQLNRYQSLKQIDGVKSVRVEAEAGPNLRGKQAGDTWVKIPQVRVTRNSNPNHDELGRFAPASASPKVQKELDRVSSSFSRPQLSETEKAAIYDWKTGNSTLLKDESFIAAVEKGRVTKDITLYRAGGTATDKALEFSTRESWVRDTAEASDREVTTLHLKAGDKALFVPYVTEHHLVEVGVMLPPSTMALRTKVQNTKGNSSERRSEIVNPSPTYNELPSRFSETSMESAQDGTRPNFQHKVSGADGGTGPQTVEGTGILSSGQLGTDAQYTGIQLSPSEYPSTKGSKEAKRLLFIRCYDESLVQIVQYEANVRNPRFGMPVMYRITLNDPREQHSGIGLPMATVRVHWSRIIHVSDNNGSSEIFGVPRMRPVLNRLLDLRKIYASSAEGYWQQAFAKLVLSTHPQLGGDVKVNVPQLQNMLENVRNGLQREMLLMGMGASTVAPSVTDPTSHIAVHIEAICIQLGCPVRVFKGSERGELASAQDDDEWLDHVRFRQHNQCTPKILIPLIDRLIAAGVLPAPGSGAEPVGKKVPMGKGWKKEGKEKDATNGNGSGSNGNALGMKSSDSPSSDVNDEESSVIGNRMTWNRKLGKWVNNAFPPKAGQPPSPSSQENGKGSPPSGENGDGKGAPPAPKPPKVEVPDSGKPVGYSVQWPDLDSLGDKDKAAIALQIVQAIQAYIAGGCEAVLPVFDFFVHVLGWDEEMVTPILLKVRAAAEKDDQGEPVEPPLTTPPHGEPGHPTSAPEPPVFLNPKGQDDSQGKDEEPEDQLETASISSSSSSSDKVQAVPSTNSLHSREKLEAVLNWCNQYGGTTCKEGSSGWKAQQAKNKASKSNPSASPNGKEGKEVSKPTQASVKETKTDPGKQNVQYTNGRVLRSAREALEHPVLKAMGSSLNAKDVDKPEVSKHLQDLTKVPVKLANAVREAGQKVFVGSGSITGLDDNSHLAGRVSTQNHIDYEKMPACYSQTRKVVSVGTGSSGSSSMALHEYGHSVDDSLGLSKDPDLKEIHKAQYDKLKPYYQNGGPGGEKGMKEMVAEGFASYHVDRDRCLKDYGSAFVGWLSNKLKNYQ